MFRAHHDDDPPIEAPTPGDQGTGREHLKLLKQLVDSFALTNRLLAVSYGSDGGVADRRNGTPFYIDLGIEIPLPDNSPSAPPESYIPVTTVDTSRINQLITPTLGSNDIRYTIGVDSFSVHRTAAPDRSWPITVLAPSLQSSTGSRYLTLLAGEQGTSLSGTASSVVFDYLPSSFNVTLGFMDPIPVDASGALSSTIYPLVFNDTWLTEAVASGSIPVIPGGATSLWTSSNIYALTIRLYIIPTITPRVVITTN